jgi:hypothetical protein
MCKLLISGVLRRIAPNPQAGASASSGHLAKSRCGNQRNATNRRNDHLAASPVRGERNFHQSAGDMFFRPSGAWGDFPRIPYPQLAPWATIFRPSGAELLEFRRIEMAAKNITVVSNSPIILDPTSGPKLLESPAEDKGDEESGHLPRSVWDWIGKPRND